VKSPGWFRDALCREVGWDLFFSEEAGSEAYSKATKVCKLCRVRPECLDYAIANDEQYGIWGGHGLRSRRRIAQQREEDAA
jgi:WhiB family redox-sensing transcriptional regulator